MTSNVALLYVLVNLLVTNGFSHPYHLDESTFIFRGIRSNFLFLFHFSMKFKKANRIAPDGTPRSAASYLGLFCLTMPHKKDARLIWFTIHVTTYYSIVKSILLINSRRKWC